MHSFSGRLATLREELEDLNDYLDVTEARVRDSKSCGMSRSARGAVSLQKPNLS